MLQPSPPRYSSMSPLMTYSEDDFSQSRVIKTEPTKYLSIKCYFMFRWLTRRGGSKK